MFFNQLFWGVLFMCNEVRYLFLAGDLNEYGNQIHKAFYVVILS